MKIDPELLKAFRRALIPGDLDRVTELLDQEVGLLNSQPWGEEWPVSALEAVATQCVHHRPQMHQIARLLVTRGARCSLQTAARAGLIDVVRRELDRDPGQIEAIDDEDRTALYRAACLYGTFAEAEVVVDELIARGAAVDLYSACTLGLRDRVAEHLRHDPTAAGSVDAEGMTPLHWSVRLRRHHDQGPPITRLLLEHGADVHATNPTEDEMTAMHHVAEWCGHPDQVSLLIEHGADLNATARNGWTPLDYALDRGRDEMSAFLRGLGAKVSTD